MRGLLQVHHRLTQVFSIGFDCEHTCWDPKDSELCLSRTNLEETLVKASSNTDIQIIHLT